MRKRKFTEHQSIDVLRRFISLVLGCITSQSSEVASISLVTRSSTSRDTRSIAYTSCSSRLGLEFADPHQIIELWVCHFRFQSGPDVHLQARGSRMGSRCPPISELFLWTASAGCASAGLSQYGTGPNRCSRCSMNNRVFFGISRLLG